MSPQETTEVFARLAKPLLDQALKNLAIPHSYDPDPGTDGCTSLLSGAPVVCRIIETHGQCPTLSADLADDQALRLFVKPAVSALIEKISNNIEGRAILITKKVAQTKVHQGGAAHVEGVGWLRSPTSRFTSSSISNWINWSPA